MPYITQKDREKFIHDKEIYVEHCKNAGELNFVFTSIIQNYLKHHGLNYQRINDALGALEGCKLELYRRIVSPYEDEKIYENGDLDNNRESIRDAATDFSEYLIKMGFRKYSFLVGLAENEIIVYFWEGTSIPKKLLLRDNWDGYPVKYEYNVSRPKT